MLRLHYYAEYLETDERKKTVGTGGCRDCVRLCDRAKMDLLSYLGLWNERNTIQYLVAPPHYIGAVHRWGATDWRKLPYNPTATDWFGCFPKLNLLRLHQGVCRSLVVVCLNVPSPALNLKSLADALLREMTTKVWAVTQFSPFARPPAIPDQQTARRPLPEVQCYECQLYDHVRHNCLTNPSTNPLPAGNANAGPSGQGQK